MRINDMQYVEGTQTPPRNNIHICNLCRGLVYFLAKANCALATIGVDWLRQLLRGLNCFCARVKLCLTNIEGKLPRARV